MIVGEDPGAAKPHNGRRECIWDRDETMAHARLAHTHQSWVGDASMNLKQGSSKDGVITPISGGSYAQGNVLEILGCGTHGLLGSMRMGAAVYPKYRRNMDVHEGGRRQNRPCGDALTTTR